MRKITILSLLLLLNNVLMMAEDTITSVFPRHFYDSRQVPFLVEQQTNSTRDKDRTLYFSPEITTFARDAEYFLPYTEGYTALGFHFNPSITYRANKALEANIGVHLTGIAGDHTKIREVAPIVRLQYTPAEWISFVGGSLFGNLCHNLYEPMYGFDRYYRDNQEMGLQIFAHTKHWNTEVWCNWEDFIEIDSDWQEKFTFGWVNNFKITPFRDTTTRFEIPLHLMMNHRGGQINTLPDTCLETLANIAAGLAFQFETARTQTRMEVPFFLFSNRSNEEHIHTHFKDGWGVYPQVTVQNNHPKHHWSATIGYWHGQGFIAGRGSYLFQSRSYFDDNFERKYRDMATLKATYCLNKILGFEAQAYYDFSEPGIDYSFGIYLFFDRDFKIHTFKKKTVKEPSH